MLSSAFGQVGDEAAAASSSCSVQFVAADWPTVLRSTAAAFGATLVMDEIPPGRFTRLDHRRYGKSDVVRILNTALAGHGYRILEKGNYLVVVRDMDLRPRFPRPTIDTVATTSQITDQQESSNRHGSDSLPSLQTRTRQRSPLVARQLHLQRDPRHVAGILLRSFRDQATWERQQELNSRLVIFAVHADQPPESVDQRAVRSILELDVKASRITVWSRAERLASWQQLVASLDQEHGLATPQVLSVEPKVMQAIPSITPILQHVAQNQPSTRAPSRANPSLESTTDTASADEKLRRLIRGLQGNVEVETIPDLGVITIRGDPEDVEAVNQIIRQLRQLIVGPASRIHLRVLREVNSESLARLLNSVYEGLGQLGDTPGGPAAIILPVENPNALLILAGAAELESILQLIDQLDRPLDSDAEFVILRLESAAAVQMLDLLREFYEGRGDLAVHFQAAADVRTNSLVVQARPRDLDAVIRLVRQLDNDVSKATSQLRVIPLENALASEVATVINSTLQGLATASPVGGSTGTQSGNAVGPARGDLAKSIILHFLADPVTGRVVHSGSLRDIRVEPDSGANSLVVVAPQQSMKMMEALIARLDQPSSVVADVKVFALKNADAGATVELLRGLFGATKRGNLAESGGAAGQDLFPVQFSMDRRTNSILMAGDPEKIQVIEAILFRLDETSDRQHKNTVYRLKNSPAEEVAAAVNQFLNSQRERSQVDAQQTSASELLEREVIVVPEAVNNSLLISATPRYFDEIVRIIDRLDEAPEQVVIQALLVEVELAANDEFGVELGFQDSVLFDRSVVDDLVTITETITSPNGVQTTTERIISQTAEPGFLFNNQTLGNNTAVRPSTIGRQGLSHFSLGRINGDLGYGGLVLSASSESVSVLVRALAARRRIHILSRPQIRSLDNQLAQIQVGQQVPVVDGVTISGTGSANPVIRQDNAGIILSVTPRVRPDQTIVMEVLAEKSQFSGPGVPIFTDANTGNVVESPVKSITMAHTTVSVPDSQTIVLGGMITTTDTEEERRVPWLGDIPIVGNLFRYDSAMSVRRELLIFLTPRVVRTPFDSEMIKEVEMKRLHFLEREAEEVHGPLLGIPEPLVFESASEVVQPGQHAVSPNASEQLLPVPDSLHSHEGTHN